MGQIIQAARKISQTCKFLTWLFQFINFYAVNVVISFTVAGVILKTKFWSNFSHLQLLKYESPAGGF